MERLAHLVQSLRLYRFMPATIPGAYSLMNAYYFSGIDRTPLLHLFIRYYLKNQDNLWRIDKNILNLVLSAA